MNQRLSNIELVRCLSMFMVLLLHSSFMVYGMPDSLEINKAPGFWGGIWITICMAVNIAFRGLFVDNIYFNAIYYNKSKII